MYCKKCNKSLPEDSTFCPYCGNEKLEAEPVAEEVAAEEAVEETTAEETVAEETAVEETVAEKDGDKIVEGKKGGALVGALCIVIALLVAAVAYLGIKYFGGEDTPDVTTADTPVTTAPAGETELFPMDYQTVYTDGIDYAALNLDEYITLGDYKGLTVTLTTSREITDGDIAERIAEILAQHAEKQTVTDRAAQNGDIVNIDFVGSIDGVEFEGGAAQGSEVTIGAGGFIPGFEEGIIGMQTGEVKVIDATFPENYGVETLNGKTAQFEITLNSISEMVEPEYNDQFVRDNFDMDTMPQFEAYVHDVLAEERENEILLEKQNGVLTQSVDNATVIKYPEGIVEDYMWQQIDSTRYYGAMYYGMEYSEFVKMALGISAAEYEAEIRDSASLAVKQEMTLFAIFAKEGLEITEEDRAAALDYYFEYYEAEDVATLCQNLGVTEQYFENTISFSIVFEKVINHLVDNATFIGAE